MVVLRLARGAAGPAVAWSFGIWSIAAQSLTDFIENALIIAKEVDEFIVAKKNIRIIRLGEKVPAPTVVHCYLQKRGQIFGLIFQTNMARSFVQQAAI
jgi:hypothetical protein